jgi:hypothetical protein
MSRRVLKAAGGFARISVKALSSLRNEQLFPHTSLPPGSPDHAAPLARVQRGEVWASDHPGPYRPEEKAAEIARLKSHIARTAWLEHAVWGWPPTKNCRGAIPAKMARQIGGVRGTIWQYACHEQYLKIVFFGCGERTHCSKCEPPSIYPSL